MVATGADDTSLPSTIFHFVATKCPFPISVTTALTKTLTYPSALGGHTLNAAARFMKYPALKCHVGKQMAFAMWEMARNATWENTWPAGRFARRAFRPSPGRLKFGRQACSHGLIDRQGELSQQTRSSSCRPLCMPQGETPQGCDGALQLCPVAALAYGVSRRAACSYKVCKRDSEAADKGGRTAWAEVAQARPIDSNQL